MSQSLTPPPAPSGPLADPERLVESSHPQPPPGPLRFVRPGTAMWLVLGALLVMVLPLEPGVRVGLEMVLWTSFIAVIVYLWTFVRALRAESQRLDQIEDWLAMKRYMEVGIELEQLMSKPMRFDQHRLRAMVLLATTLARCGRFDDALKVYNQLVEVERVAGPSGAMVKLGRAMAMLQTDHLYDADRAINDLRRLIDRGGAGEELQQFEPDAPVIAADPLSISALRLVELYRDIKTGHADEAIALFESNLPLMTSGLGHRVGEAYALVAVAYDRVGNTDTARARFLDGTALQGVGDLLNRYPEVRPLIAKYAPTPVPVLP